MVSFGNIRLRIVKATPIIPIIKRLIIKPGLNEIMSERKVIKISGIVI